MSGPLKDALDEELKKVMDTIVIEALEKCVQQTGNHRAPWPLEKIQEPRHWCIVLPLHAS